MLVFVVLLHDFALTFFKGNYVSFRLHSSAIFHSNQFSNLNVNMKNQK